MFVDVMTMARSKSKKRKRAYNGPPRNSQETIAALQSVFGIGKKTKVQQTDPNALIGNNESGVILNVPELYRRLTDKKLKAQKTTQQLEQENAVLQEQLKQATIKRQNEELKKQIEAQKVEEQKALPSET